ncbi:MAE_28990/MAE_18760 family HEPN-like nuclease [Mesorhizobium sp. M0633]|uniref:MAE_28990/MAE_18760 family HEPN-like nuclease n=1 Tax=Mesorhizobium sp. M0633 TaxID=2956977 RepID=UPI00333A6C55
MPSIDRFFDEIDGNRSRRARELSEIETKFSDSINADPMGIGSKAVVVLTYSHWEGFYNDCVKTYIEFLKERGGRIRDSDWMMLSGAFLSEFQSLQNKNHSFEARSIFINKMKDIIESGFDIFSVEVVLARSNLNFAKLSENYKILDFDLQPFQRHRIKLDKELVQWRHQVAHGDQPDLSALDIGQHINLTSNLLLLVADRFQQGILDRLPP